MMEKYVCNEDGWNKYTVLVVLQRNDFKKKVEYTTKCMGYPTLGIDLSVIFDAICDDVGVDPDQALEDGLEFSLVNESGKELLLEISDEYELEEYIVSVSIVNIQEEA